MKYMSDVIWAIGLVTVIILFSGEPDIADGIINYLNSK